MDLLNLDEGVPVVAAGALVLVVGSLVEGRFHVPKCSGRLNFVSTASVYFKSSVQEGHLPVNTDQWIRIQANKRTKNKKMSNTIGSAHFSLYSQFLFCRLAFGQITTYTVIRIEILRA